MIQSLLFNILYFVVELMHGMRVKVQGLRTCQKPESLDLRTQNDMHVGHDVRHHFGMPKSALISNALRVHHTFGKKVKLADHRSAHSRFDVQNRFSSSSQAPGGRYHVYVKTFKKVYGEVHVDHDLHRYDVMICLNTWKEVVLTIGG